MKKLILSFFAVAMIAVSATAQSSFQLYKFTESKQADVVLKVLSSELKLNDNQFSSIKQLIMGSAQSQIEQYKSELAKNPEHVANIVRRQSTHIEGNLKNILGEDKYKIYESSKSGIEKKVQEMLSAK